MNTIEQLIASVAKLPRDTCRSIVFAKHEGIIVPKHEHPYFKTYLPDDRFQFMGYTDVVSGRYSDRYNAKRWCTELCNTFHINQVETAILYFRPEHPDHLDIRILVKTPEYLRRR